MQSKTQWHSNLLKLSSNYKLPRTFSKFLKTFSSSSKTYKSPTNQIKASQNIKQLRRGSNRTSKTQQTSSSKVRYAQSGSIWFLLFGKQFLDSHKLVPWFPNLLSVSFEGARSCWIRAFDGWEQTPDCWNYIFFCMFKLHPNFRSASLTLESRGKIGRSQDKVQPLCALCTRFMSFAQQLGAGQETCGATRVWGWAMVILKEPTTLHLTILINWFTMVY